MSFYKNITPYIYIQTGKCGKQPSTVVCFLFKYIFVCLFLFFDGISCAAPGIDSDVVFYVKVQLCLWRRCGGGGDLEAIRFIRWMWFSQLRGSRLKGVCGVGMFSGLFWICQHILESFSHVLYWHGNWLQANVEMSPEELIQYVETG